MQVYSNRPHLRDLKKFNHPNFSSLRSVVERGQGEIEANGWKEFLDAARMLDEKLLTWRGLHLGFARGYLPPATAATGGTSGAPYLQQFLKGGIFNETTADPAVLREVFPDFGELLDELRVPAGHHFAPAEHRRTVKRASGKYPELITIPAGTFLMGSDPQADEHARPDESPRHEVRLEKYGIGKTPVTNRQYEEFVQATGHRLPLHWSERGGPVGREDYPVVLVSLHDAFAYAKWLSAELNRTFTVPSEAEWEKAARGQDGRLFPWGNEWNPTLCNTYESNRHDIVDVGRFPDGASPYKILGMGGNVFEWTRSAYKPYPYQPADDGHGAMPESGVPVIRGCGCAMGREYARCASRMWLDPKGREVDRNLIVPDLSFRVVEHFSA